MEPEERLELMREAAIAFLEAEGVSDAREQVKVRWLMAGGPEFPCLDVQLGTLRLYAEGPYQVMDRGRLRPCGPSFRLCINHPRGAAKLLTALSELMWPAA